MNTPEQPTILTARHYGILAAICVVIVVYGSLIPLQFKPMSFSEGIQQFQVEWAKGVRFESKSDWLANIFLFVPLGFCLCGIISVDRFNRGLHCLACFPACVVLSLFVEFLQVWCPTRSPSPNDIVAESMGAILGIGIWIYSGQRITEEVRRFWCSHAGSSWAAKLLPLYGIFLFGMHAMPFDLSISPGELAQKYRQGKVNLLPIIGCSHDVLAYLQKQLINFAYFFPVGVLLAALSPEWREDRTLLRVSGIGVALTGVIEFMQIFVLTRYFDTTDILTGTLAVVAGWWMVIHWPQTPVFLGRRRAPRWLWAGLLVWTIALAFIAWQPFSFNTDSKHITERWATFTWVPFSEYQAGSYLHVFDQMIQKILFFIPIGLLPILAVGEQLRSRFVMLGSLGLSCLLQLGQLFLDHHQPGVSDILLQTIGSSVGYLIGLRVLTLIPEMAGGQKLVASS